MDVQKNKYMVSALQLLPSKRLVSNEQSERRYFKSLGNTSPIDCKTTERELAEIVPFTWKLNVSDFRQYFDRHLLHGVLSRVRQTSNHLLKTIIKYEQS